MATLVEKILEGVEITESGLKVVERRVPGSPEHILFTRLLGKVGVRWSPSAKEYRWLNPDSVRKFKEALNGNIQLLSRRSIKLDQAICPAGLVPRMVDYLNLKHSYSVLEPSAGVGTLLHGLPLHRRLFVTAVESNKSFADRLQYDFPHAAVHNTDFLAWRTEKQFDNVIMYPPITARQDVWHVSKAITHLSPRGRLVAILSPAILFSSAASVLRFRKLLGDFDTTLQRLTKEEFSRGTDNVRAVMLFMRRR